MKDTVTQLPATQLVKMAHRLQDFFEEYGLLVKIKEISIERTYIDITMQCADAKSYDRLTKWFTDELINTAGATTDEVLPQAVTDTATVTAPEASLTIRLHNITIESQSLKQVLKDLLHVLKCRLTGKDDHS